MKEILLFFICTSFAYSQSIRLISPNGGENWSAGAQYEIKWESDDVSNLRIEISMDNGNTWETITSAYPAFMGSYFWSAGKIKSNHALIKITDAGNDLTNDVSDSVFFINKNIIETNNQFSFLDFTSLQVTSPNGGETLQGGSNINITWSSSGTGNVDIDYSINGGINWTSIASNVSGSPYSWTVPNTPANQALIRVSENGGGLSDESDSFFFIEDPQFSSGTIVKILPFGNSITFGTDKTPGLETKDLASYRYQLWNLLINNGYNFGFIGSELSGYGIFSDYQNAGFGGTVTANLLNILEVGINDKFNPDDIVTNGPYLNTYPADIILIHAGTNDFIANSQGDTTNIVEIIDYIHDYDPNIWMIVAKILNSPDNTISSNFGVYNSNLEAVVKKRINLNYNILMVDMYNIPGFNYTTSGTNPDMSDDLHPDASGYVKMADVWYDALKLILQDGTLLAPVFETPAVTSASINRPYNYTPHASNTETYSLPTKPAGMTIDATTGKISWTPSVVDDYAVTVRATNDDGDTDQSFTIKVTNLQTWPVDLVSYWKFDDPQDPSNNFLDSYGLNSGFSETALTSTGGQVRTAFNFDGTDKVNIVDQPELSFVNTSFTVEAWVKRSGNGQDRTAVGKYGRTLDESYWWLGINNSNQPTFFTSFKLENGDTRTDKQAKSSESISDNTWAHIVGVKNGTTNIKIYVNGVLKQTVSTGSSLDYDFSSTRPLNIGHWYNSNIFTGAIDEVAIYDKVLTDAEISDHYDRGINFGKGYFDNFVLLSTKIFLEGPYNTTNDNMNTLLTIPTASPYSQDARTVSSIPANTVDWVLIELRSSDTGPAIAYKSAFLRNDGMVVGDDGSSPVVIDVVPGSYYIILRHRNHLAVMSSNSVALDDNSTTPSVYDFTTGSEQFYGATDGAKEIETNVWGMIAGDANSSGSINTTDYLVVKPDINEPADYYKSDINLNGTVNTTDYLKIKPNVGNSQVPIIGNN